MDSYLNLPAYGASNWKPSVSTAVDLPAINNSNGDVRVTLDTGDIWEFNVTAWQLAGGGGGGGAVWGSITGTLSSQTDLQNALNAKQDTITPGNLLGNTGAGISIITGTGVLLSNAAIDQQQANGSGPGFLASADWTIFNNKQNLLTIGNLTDPGTDGITITGGTGAVIGTGAAISQHVSDATHNGYLNSSDWSTFNAKISPSQFNYITNSDAEINTVGWNLYNNSGRIVPASLTNQDLTYTSALSGNGGNGVEIEYIYNASFPSTTPNINVISSSHVQVQWNNGPTIANNPTAAQLQTAWNAVPAALAIATIAITGTASKLQYITGGEFLSNGGDSSPTNGTNGSISGVTFTRNITTPLIGVASFDLGKTSSSEQGQGVSTDFVIDSIDKDKPLQINFVYQGSSNMVLGANSDVQVFMYDIDNASLIQVTPLETIAGPVSTPKQFTALFTTTTSSNYRLILHIATINAASWDLLLDSVFVTDELNPVAATQVPSVVLQDQPISGAVTDHMVVMWRDGATQWVPATIVGACIPAFGTDQTQLGFATNIEGSTADIFVSGFMDGFSFGPFTGFDQYIDNTAGGISPLPAPFTDLYCIVGMAISTTALNIEFVRHVDLISNGSGVPIKGGLLTNSAVNDSTGDIVVSPGANGTFLLANSAVADGIQWVFPVATAPLVYTPATHTFSCNIATTSITGALSSTDWTTFNNKAPIASPTFTGTPTLPTGTIAVTQAAGSSTTAVATTAFVTTANNLKANLASPTFTGTPTMPTGAVAVTQAAGNSTTAIATTAFVTTADNLKAPLASPTFTGDVTASTGNLLISTLGKGLEVKTGTNSKIGTAVLVAGTVTVANSSVTANSRIFVTSQTDGGTVGAIRVSAKVVSTSFTITSLSALDTSTVAWTIVESIP